MEPYIVQKALSSLEDLCLDLPQQERLERCRTNLLGIKSPAFSATAPPAVRKATNEYLKARGAPEKEWLCLRALIWTIARWDGILAARADAVETVEPPEDESASE